MNIVKKEILKVNNLTKYYGKVLGVKHLSFSLYQGEVFGFIGPNGAGKSTTIRLIMNLINKTEGSIYMNGEKLTKKNIALKEMIGYLPSEIHLYEDMTVKEMLDYHESFYKKDLRKRRKELVQRLKLDESRKIEDLSLGNSKKLGIVLAFMHEPKLLVLDEPTSGLDPIMQQVFYQLLQEEKEKGTTIFYSTHILSEVSKICDRVGFIKDGKLLKVETTNEIRNKNLTFVTLESHEVDAIIKKLKLEVLERRENMIRFQNFLSADELVKSLSKYQIDKVLIEEATLEDMFLHYYK